MTSLKLKSWMLVAGFALSPFTIHAAVNKDSFSNSVSNKKPYNFISIGRISSSFSDYISRSVSGTRHSADNLNHESGNIYSASFGYLVPNMVHMINYQTFGSFDYKPLADRIGNIHAASDSTSEGNAFISFANNPSAFSSISEPKTYTMMLAGLGLMVFVARRRKVGHLQY